MENTASTVLLPENEQLRIELSELRERLYELEELELARVTEDQERFDALQVLDEYAKQIEESRDKLTRLFKAANAVQEARSIQEALERIAEAVQDAGWGSVSVSLFKNWQVVQAAYAGCSAEDIAFLENNRRAPSERARQYGPEFDRFHASRSYFVPAEELPGLLPVDSVCPGRREVQPGDNWNPMDLAYVPLIGSGGRVIGCINCDDPVDGKRPQLDTFTYLELFADIASSKVETTRLIEQQRRTAEAYRESEEKYRTLFTRSGDGYLLMDDRIRDCNQKICEIMGSSRHELLGSSFAANAPEFQPDGSKSVDSMRNLIAHAMNEGHQNFYWRLARKDGQIVDSDITLSNVEIGGETLLLAVVRDITDKKRTEAALEESETRFRAIADAAPLLIWISDRDMNMTFFNGAWQEFTGRSDDELCGMGWESDVHPDDLTAVKSALKAIYSTKEKSEVECRLRRHDGHYRWFMNVGAPRFDTDGNFLGFVGTCIEINQHMFDGQVSDTMSRISKMLLTSESMNAVYQELPRIIQEWCDFTAVSIELRDTTSSELVRVAQCGIPEQTARRTPLSGSPAEECILNGQRCCVTHVEETDRAAMERWVGVLDVSSYMCVPITLKNRVLGVISLMSVSVRDNAADYLRPVELIADSLAQAIERRRAEDESVRLAAFQRENPNLAIACDTRGNVTYVNPTGIKLLKEYGLPLFPGLLPPDHKPLVKKCVVENAPIHGVITTAGPRSLSWSYHNVPSVQTVHLIGVDITEQLRMEREIDMRERRRKAVLEAALDCIITIDENGTIIEFNPAAVKTFGFKAEDVIGKPISSTIIPPAYRERHIAGLAQYIKTGESSLIGKRVKIVALCQDGREIPVELTLTSIPGEPIHYFTAFLRELEPQPNSD